MPSPVLAPTSTLTTLGDDELAAFKQLVRQDVKGAASLEDAAQRFTELFYRQFAASTVLVRVYVTLPFDRLPDEPQRFARAVARGSADKLKPTTQVLTLLGTTGVDPTWNARRASKGHVAIPLIDATFVSAIPMVQSLLEQMGMELRWVDQDAKEFTRRLIGGFIGVFHVPEAASTVNRLGRHIIPAQDFVAAHGVKTVFGAGGAYLDGTMVAMVVFARETVARNDVDRLGGLITIFKSLTTTVIRERHYFT